MDLGANLGYEKVSRKMADSQFGRLTIWPTHNLAEWQFGRFTICLIHYFVNSQFGQYIIWSIRNFVNSQFGQYIIWSIHSLVEDFVICSNLGLTFVENDSLLIWFRLTVTKQRSLTLFAKDYLYVQYIYTRRWTSACPINPYLNLHSKQSKGDL
jgi:hypothetical protein